MNHEITNNYENPHNAIYKKPSLRDKVRHAVQAQGAKKLNAEKETIRSRISPTSAVGHTIRKRMAWDVTPESHPQETYQAGKEDLVHKARVTAGALVVAAAGTAIAYGLAHRDGAPEPTPEHNQGGVTLEQDQIAAPDFDPTSGHVTIKLQK